MRFFRFVIPVLCAITLSACSGTMHGVKKDVKETGMWAKGKGPTAMERAVGAVPTAYTGQNRRGVVLKPPGLNPAPAPAPVAEAPLVPAVTISGGGPVWNDVGDYDSWNSGPSDLAPIGSDSVIVNPPPSMPQGQDYNDAVRVFSLDGDFGAPAYAYNTPAWQGRLEEKVFFNHGSSAVRKADKGKIRKLAKKAKRKSDVAVTVVGHASKRVDRVKDPLKKKMINFAMAQKRANAVTRELNLAGLKPGWVQAVSKGDDEPNPAPGPMPQEVADRRVEIYMEDR